MKAMEEAEALRLQEEAARKASLEAERQKEEESRKKLEEELVPFIHYLILFLYYAEAMIWKFYLFSIFNMLSFWCERTFDVH